MRRKRGCCLWQLIKWILIILILCGVVRYGMERVFPMPHREAVENAAAENGISPALIYAVILAESRFDAAAESEKGAKGLMQLMDETAAWCAQKSGYPLTDIEKPEENIYIGTYYLAYLLKRYNGNEACAIAAYNAGHGRVDKWLENPAYTKDGASLTEIPFPETKDYVKKVRLFKKIYTHRL